MNLYSEIKGYKHTKTGTELKLIVPDEELGHKIKRYREGGEVTADLYLNDPRYLSPGQRKKIYALLGDISYYTGEDPEFLKGLMKYRFIAKTGAEYFSLSPKAVEDKCSVTTARVFLDFLVTFCFEQGIPFQGKWTERTDDIDRIMFLCIKHRQCVDTGERAELHHCTGSTVGMGSNRKKISHSGRFFIALSPTLHKEIHNIGDKEFFEKYHCYGVQVDDETLKDLGYKVDEIEDHTKEEEQ